MAKRKTKSGLNLDENSAKAVLSLLVLLIAFGVFMLFSTYQESLLSSPSLKFFTILVAVLFALLIGLLFLINPQKNKR
jgi:hypothetical protein